MYEKLQKASHEAHNTEIKYNFKIPVNKAKVTPDPSKINTGFE
jgi:hypothetical protein